MQDGFIQGKVYECCGFQLIGLLAASGNHHLRMRPQKHAQGDAIGRGEQAVMIGNAGKGSQRAFGKVAILRVIGVGVQAQQPNRRRGISRGRGGILHRFAARGQRSKN